MDIEDDFEESGGVGGGGGDDDLSLPRATVNKIINDMLPENIQCAKETRELLINCCVEFIHVIASEANDICEKESRKTINPEHVLAALKSLGFEGYLDEVTKVHEDHKNDHHTKSSFKKKDTGSSESAEELKRKQEELFQAARKFVAQQQQPPPSS